MNKTKVLLIMRELIKIKCYKTASAMWKFYLEWEVQNEFVDFRN